MHLLAADAVSAQAWSHISPTLCRYIHFPSLSVRDFMAYPGDLLGEDDYVGAPTRWRSLTRGKDDLAEKRERGQ